MNARVENFQLERQKAFCFMQYHPRRPNFAKRPLTDKCTSSGANPIKDKFKA